MNDPRLLESPSFTRGTADAALLAKISGWDEWACADAEFRYEYEQTVTLYVHQGAAIVSFADGSHAELIAGDTMTIRQGSKAIWAISEPIHNSYMVVPVHNQIT